MCCVRPPASGALRASPASNGAGTSRDARCWDLHRAARRRTDVGLRSWRLFALLPILLAAAAAVCASAAAHGRSRSGQPAWATRGFLVFRCERGGLCLARPGRRDLRPLAGFRQAPQWDPAISPNGRAVAFRGYWGVGDGAYALYVIGTNACIPRRITRGIAGDPSWSPDGKWIVFDTSGAGQLWKVRPEGTGLTRLGGGRFEQETSPSWSPRGNKIAFVRTPNGGRGQIWVMNATGARPVVLRASARISYEEPSWSKDGEQIAFVAVPTGPGGVQGARSWIDVMDANGSHVRAVTSEKGHAWNPVWPPGDAGIAWLSGLGSVYAARANGTHVTEVLRARAEEFAWSGAGLARSRCG